jgi:hypothetical protein
MRKAATLLGVGILSFFVLRSLACTSDAREPDEKLADHLDNLCSVAERGIKSPDDGVRRLFAYFGENGPQMLHTFGDLLVTIERIDDDRRHDERARVANRRLRARLLACRTTWERFAESVERDDRASRRLERGLDRFGRTMEIIFGQAMEDLPMKRYARPVWPLWK